jgi:predicted nucleic acid-binding protein
VSDPPLGYLLDSDWVIDYLSGRPEAQRMIDGLRPRGIAISVVTYLEVTEGILGSRDRGHAEAVFRTFLRSVEILGMTAQVARRAAEVRFDLRSRRRPITNRAMDLLIAATALELGLVLVSRNSRDYDDVVGLERYATR